MCRKDSNESQKFYSIDKVSISKLTTIVQLRYQKKRQKRFYAVLMKSEHIVLVFDLTLLLKHWVNETDNKRT